jgi:hypothetical protein
MSQIVAALDGVIPTERSNRCEQDCCRWLEGVGSRCSREFCVKLYQEQARTLSDMPAFDCFDGEIG